MSQALSKLTGVLSKIDTTAIFINQVREKIGVMYGNPETTTGGKALKFCATMRLDVRRIGQPVKTGNDPVDTTVEIKMVKNKVAPPFKAVELTLLFSRSFDQLSDPVTLASDMEIVKKVGSFYSHNDECIGQGKGRAIAYIGERPVLEQESRERVLTAIKVGNMKPEPAQDGEALADVS